MKIVFMSSGHNVLDGRFLRKMVERGHETYLVANHPRRVQVPVEGVTYLNFWPRFPRLRTLQIAVYLRWLLRRIQPDILHSGVVQTHGFYGALSGFHPTLLMPMGSDILLAPDVSWTLRLKTKYTINRADMITCDCEVVRRRIIELTRYPKEKIVVFPQGIDLRTFQPGPSSLRAELGWKDKKVLISTRNFNPIVGVEFFVESLPRVIMEEPQTRVILVGSGPLESHLRLRIGELGLQDYVYFTGSVDERMMANCLNSADVYIATSLSDGTSLSLLEAMACALPVVVSDAPANREWVEDGINGYIVPRGDSPHLAPLIDEFLTKQERWYSDTPWDSNNAIEGCSPLAKRIVQLLRNPELRQIMGRRNYDIAQERANWERNFDKLEAIYKTLAAHHRGES